MQSQLKTSRRQSRRHPAALIGLCIWLAQALAVPCALAAEAEEGESTNAVQIETTADTLEYDRKTGIVTAIGNVVITRGDTRLTANSVRVNVDTEWAEAFGNVTITRGEDVWTGPSIEYNLKTGEGLTKKMTASADPFFIDAEETEKSSRDVFILHNARVTTCKNDRRHRHFEVKARKLEVKPDTYLKARRAVWYFGPVPSMYIPYWYRNLEDDFGFRFYPGHSSKMGYYLLSSYHYRINQGMTGETHLDYRSERGVGVGQDFKWNTGGDKHKGKLQTYYLNDDKPIDDDEDAATSDVDDQRYRIRIQDQILVTERDLVLMRGHYLSDTDIIEDFFEDEFREERQPDNFVSYTHLESEYTAGLIVRSRLNDFYDSVNRLPEGTLDIFRSQLGDSAFFHESVSSAAFIEQVFKDGSSKDDFDSFRLDSSHTLLRPDKHFGFLTLIPRVGLRGTYYSTTRELRTVAAGASVTSNIVVSGSVTNIGVTSVPSSNTVTRSVDGDSDFRGLVELGFETSFKAFKVWESAFGARRHIVEPFANYTLVPEPSLTPDELPQFDDIDKLGEQQTMKFGVRNKYQSRHEAGPFDIIDAEVFTVYDFNAEGDEDALEDLFWDIEIQPTEHVRIDAEGQWKLSDSELEQFNLLVNYEGAELYEARAEMRYRQDDSSLFYGDITLYPQAPWSYNFYGRYEGEESRLEEMGAQVQRTYDCLAVRTGVNSLPGFTRSDGTEKDDELRFTIEFWLTAFPEMSMRTKHRQ